MSNTIRLCLVLHNHQPVGNFDGVFEQAYQDSYLPFLEVFERYDDIKISLHMSGPLARWLQEHHSDYLDRIKDLVMAERIEIVGGGFYEPILTMLPPRDRQAQIRTYTKWLQDRFDSQVQGAWIAERVWESCLTSDLASAGIRYSVLDDFHFRHAGVAEDELHGYFVGEDNGQVLNLFPGSEQLRYLIPFADPQETINYLAGLAERHPGTVAVFGDDGEKFGTWPDTKQHVYGDGWLVRFFDALRDNRHWIITSTLADAVENSPPQGKVYLPDASYREMTEWAMPVDKQLRYERFKHEMEHHPLAAEVAQFARGGFWRNFKVRYPETNEMYARMVFVSNYLQRTISTLGIQDVELDPQLHQAQDHLHQGQCNCPYWHGAFGGLYLPHLRNANYRELLAAENILDQINARPEGWVDAMADDFDFDGRPEVRLANEKLVAWLSPAAGGYLYELDAREICHNLLATIDRRPEAYHDKVRQGANQNQDTAASIHDRVVFKQEGLDQRLQYDAYRRKSLVDHFFPMDTQLENVMAGSADPCGDFIAADYESVIRRGTDRVQVLLSRRGLVHDQEIMLTKGLTIFGSQNLVEITYLLEDLPDQLEVIFAPEFNFSGLPSGADDRFFHCGDQTSLGQLQTCLDRQVPAIHLVDQWLGIDCGLEFDQDTSLWTYPIETVSQSEAGFELVHQSVAVLPHWVVRGNDQGRWSTKIRLRVDTSMATARSSDHGHAPALV